ncbi:MAG: hypothetical protein ACRDRO_05325 [Pseudonocardiaceae bacterium]
MGADARTASLLYGATLIGSAIAFNLIWRHLVRAELLVAGLAPEFVRDITIRYLLGLAGYVAATLLALVVPLLTVLVSALLALMFALGPSVRPAFAPADNGGGHG